MEKLSYGNPIKAKRGFTLIELLISIGLVSFIAGIAVTIFVALTSAYDKADVVTKVNHEGLRVMEQIVRAIRSAEDASESTSPTGLLLTIPTNDANLEYSSNGNCRTVLIYKGNGVIGTLGKLYKRTSNCQGTSSCPLNSECVLTVSDVYVEAFDVAVVTDPVDPDKVTVTFTLSQSDTLADVQGKTKLEFKRTVVTRGY